MKAVFKTIVFIIFTYLNIYGAVSIFDLVPPDQRDNFIYAVQNNYYKPDHANAPLTSVSGIINNTIVSYLNNPNRPAVILFPKGTYRFTETVNLIGGSLKIIGEGAIIDNYISTSGFSFHIGNDQIHWDGNVYTLDGLSFQASDPSCNKEHTGGIAAYHLAIHVTNCGFNGLNGNGIYGEYVQYSRIEKCSFSNMGKYSIYIEQKSSDCKNNDITIRECLPNINNNSGGMWLEVHQSSIIKNTFTDASKSNDFLKVKGGDNLIANNTFESTASYNVTMLNLESSAAIPANTVISNIFQGSGGDNIRFIYMPAISGTKALDRIMFNSFNNNSLGGFPKQGLYIHAEGEYILGENWFANKDCAPGKSQALIAKKYKEYKYEVEHLPNDLNRFESSFNLPNRGVWLLTATFASTQTFGGPFRPAYFTGILTVPEVEISEDVIVNPLSSYASEHNVITCVKWDVIKKMVVVSGYTCAINGNANFTFHLNPLGSFNIYE